MKTCPKCKGRLLKKPIVGDDIVLYKLPRHLKRSKFQLAVCLECKEHFLFEKTTKKFNNLALKEIQDSSKPSSRYFGIK